MNSSIETSFKVVTIKINEDLNMKISILCALIGIFISGCESSSSTTTSKTTIRGNGGSGNDGGSSNNNDEILKIEREQQEIAKVEQDRDDKLNAMLAEIKTGDYLKNEASYQKARDYFVDNDFQLYTNKQKKDELISELKKNTLIAKTLTDYSNNPICVFNSKTLDDFKNRYDPQRKQEQEKKRQEESKKSKEEFQKKMDNNKRNFGDFTDTEKENFKTAIENYTPTSFEEGKKFLTDYMNDISKDLDDNIKDLRFNKMIFFMNENESLFDKFYKLSLGPLSGKIVLQQYFSTGKYKNPVKVETKTQDAKTIIDKIKDKNTDSDDWPKIIEDFCKLGKKELKELMDEDILNHILSNITYDNTYNTENSAKALKKLMELADDETKKIVIEKLTSNDNIAKIKNNIFLKEIKEDNNLEDIMSNIDIKKYLLDNEMYDKTKLEDFLNTPGYDKKELVNNLLASNYLQNIFSKNNLEAVNILANVDKYSVVNDIVTKNRFNNFVAGLNNYKNGLLTSLSSLDALLDSDEIKESLRYALLQIINKESTDSNPITPFINVAQELLDKDDQLGANVKENAYTVFKYVFTTKDSKQHDLLNVFITGLPVEKIAKLFNNANLLELLARLYKSVSYEKVNNLTENLAEIFAKIDFVKFLNEYAKINNNNKDLAQFVFMAYYLNEDIYKNNLKTNLNNADKELKEKIINGANSLKNQKTGNVGIDTKNKTSIEFMLNFLDIKLQ